MRLDWQDDARRRNRAYLGLRREPAPRAWLEEEIAALRAAAALGALLP